MLNLFMLLELPTRMMNEPHIFTIQQIAAEAVFLKRLLDTVTENTPLATIIDGYTEALLRIELDKRDAITTPISSPEKEVLSAGLFKSDNPPPVLKGGGGRYASDTDDFDPYMPVRSALARLSASELSMVAHHFSHTLVKKRGWLMEANTVDHITEAMSDILSDFATNGITE